MHALIALYYIYVTYVRHDTSNLVQARGISLDRSQLWVSVLTDLGPAPSEYNPRPNCNGWTRSRSLNLSGALLIHPQTLKETFLKVSTSCKTFLLKKLLAVCALYPPPWVLQLSSPYVPLKGFLLRGCLWSDRMSCLLLTIYG